MYNSAIYVGQVSHQRQAAPVHGFSYPLYMMYLDLQELPELFDKAWLWSARRPALAWFRRKDYFDDSEAPLDDAIRDFVAASTGQRPQGSVCLLTHLRYFGHCFNPLSLYYCHDEQDRLTAVVAEVSNTPWGERHCYLLQPKPGRSDVLVDEHAKEFHVSPFLSMDLEYRWRINAPADRLAVGISAVREEECVFSAALALKRRAFTRENLRYVLLRQPFVTAKVSTAIYYQALKLFLKRAQFYPHPIGDQPQT